MCEMELHVVSSNGCQHLPDLVDSCSLVLDSLANRRCLAKWRSSTIQLSHLIVSDSIMQPWWAVGGLNKRAAHREMRRSFPLHAGALRFFEFPVTKLLPQKREMVFPGLGIRDF